jgi:endoglucanase
MRASLLATLFVVGPFAALAGEDAPWIEHVGMVAPDVVGVYVRAGKCVPGHQEKIQPGDQIEQPKSEHQRWVKRGGKIIGGVVGREGVLYQTFDDVVGQALDTRWADLPGSYTLKAADDPNYKDGAAPAAVFRKSKPTDQARCGPWAFKTPMWHALYLKLPKPLAPGKEYTLSFKEAKLPERSFVFDAAKLRSEAVHVSMVGFRPDDPSKLAFLSCWLGQTGGQNYAEGTPFHVLDDRTGQSVLDGKAALSKRADDKTEDPYKRNYNGADVFVLDFSALCKPGVYRVSVNGVGCSYPFEIAPDAWRKAFSVAAKAFYHQRSGIELGPPYTTLNRPRCFHPDDGVKVYQSTCSLMDSGNGLNAKGTDKGNFGNLVKGKTDQIVPNAWGGYFDAGDWDRRIQHLEATRLLLELAELFPEFVAGAKLNIPESGNGLPDLINEACWNLDFYKRLQTPEGGIRGGIESAEHPRFGEGSWQESLTVMAYAPDPWCSFVFTGDACRAAGLLQKLKPELAKAYRESALKAMAWGDAEYAKMKDQKLPHAVRDARNLAALELFRLTGDATWHDIFLETTVFKDPKMDIWKWQSHDQRDAAFLYARLTQAGLNAEVQKNAREALLREAAESIAQGQRTAFRWTKPNAWQPVAWGVLGVPQATTLLRAHALTGDAKYLTAAVAASQYAGGANPMNTCLTTGVGASCVQNPLWIDSRIAQQPAPAGITVYGPRDTPKQKASEHWLLKMIAASFTPPVDQWPTTESYFDLYLYPEVCEFTVMQNHGPNTYVWGYLAARKAAP